MPLSSLSVGRYFSEVSVDFGFVDIYGHKIMKFQPERVHYSGESFACAQNDVVFFFHAIIRAIFFYAVVFLLQSRTRNFCVSLAQLS